MPVLKTSVGTLGIVERIPLEQKYRLDTKQRKSKKKDIAFEITDAKRFEGFPNTR